MAMAYQSIARAMIHKHRRLQCQEHGRRYRNCELDITGLSRVLCKIGNGQKGHTGPLDGQDSNLGMLFSQNAL